MHREESGKRDNPFGSIIGEHLSAVVFVQDYAQLQFSDGAMLTAVTWPAVHVCGATYRFGMQDYRDTLCERIAKTVRDAAVSEGEEIRIVFDDDSAISISLRPEDYSAAEAAILDTQPGEWWSW